MIGNDLVDLKLATQQSNWRRNNYLNKVFTNLEQEFILQATNPDAMVWSLWSRKEAVYKIIRQKGGKVGYYPKAIACLDTSTTLGKVSFNETIYFTQTNIAAAELHTIAVTKIEDFQFVKEIENCLKIQKVNEIPFLVLGNMWFAASKSHHGRFLKTICLLKDL